MLLLGQSRVQIILLNHSLVVLLSCLGFLSCYRTHFQPNFQHQEIWIHNLLIGLRIHVFLDNQGLYISRGRKAVPDLNISTTMLHCQNEVFCFSPNMSVLIETKKFYFWLICPENGLPKIFWFVQVFSEKI